MLYTDYYVSFFITIAAIMCCIWSSPIAASNEMQLFLCEEELSLQSNVIYSRNMILTDDLELRLHTLYFTMTLEYL